MIYNPLNGDIEEQINNNELQEHVDNNELQEHIDNNELQIKHIDNNELQIEHIDNKDVSICYICLKINNKTSKKLLCGCDNKFHSNCIDNLHKKNIELCPLCKKNILKNDVPDFKFFGGIILFILLMIIFIGFIFSIHIFCIDIFFPSELNYCDNNFKKCNYKKTIGKLYLNKINTIYNNYNVKYELISLYTYDIELTNYNCTSNDIHKYNSYDEVIIVSEKTLGSKDIIYYNINNKNNCKITYKLYDPIRFNLNVCSFIAVITFVLMSIFINSKNIYDNDNITIKFIDIIGIIIILTFFISSFLVFYYIIIS